MNCNAARVVKTVDAVAAGNRYVERGIPSRAEEEGRRKKEERQEALWAKEVSSRCSQRPRDLEIDSAMQCEGNAE
jgi:hypothetical protein